jgi:hypothetical protein
MSTADEIRSRIGSMDGNFVVVELHELRDAVGAKRLGKFVLEEISDWLVEEGFGYFPKWMLESNSEPGQSQELRVFLSNSLSAVALLAEAIQAPSLKGDRVLRALAGESSLDEVKTDSMRVERLREALELALQEFEANET